MTNLNGPENLICMRGLIQNIGNPFVEAFTAGLGRRGDSGVDAGWNSQRQLARVWLVRILSQLGAGVKIMVDRLFGSMLSTLISSKPKLRRSEIYCSIASRKSLI